MPTPQLVDMPKARPKAGLRRIALTRNDLAEQLEDAWPAHHGDTPQHYIDQAHEWAHESFWEDVDQWGEVFDARWVAANYNASIPATMIVDVSETVLEKEAENSGEGDWWPIYTGLYYSDFDPEAVTDEFWFEKWVNEIVPQYEEAYTKAFYKELGQDERAEKWFSMRYSPPGIGAELTSEDDIIIAKKTAQYEDESFIGELYFRSEHFQSRIRQDLPEDYTFKDILQAYVAGRAPDFEEAMKGTMEKVDDENDHSGGMHTPLSDLMPLEERAKKYLEDWCTEEHQDVIRDDYQSYIEDYVSEYVSSNAAEDFLNQLNEELVDGSWLSDQNDILKNIQKQLIAGTMTAQDLVDQKHMFEGGEDWRNVVDLLDEWEEEIEAGTIDWDDEDYARQEQADIEHEYWLQRRRNRTPEGNAYDVGDRVLLDGTEYEVTNIQTNRGDSGPFFAYSLWNDEFGHSMGTDDNLTPAPQPQQTIWPQEDLTTASILDEPAETLDPFIFDLSGDQTAPKIHDDVREQVLEQLGKARVNPDAIRSVIFFGSSAAYQYDPDSDFDITVVVDPSLVRQGDEILGLNREISDELFIAGHPVTFFFREDDYPIEGSDAIYDLIGNFWIRVPERSESALSQPEYEDTIEDATEWAKVLDVQIGELRRDVIDYEKLQGAYQRASDERKRDLYDKVQDVISQLNEDVAALANESDQLHQTRLKAFQDDLDEAGEDVAKQYLSRNWIPENVLYKVLERYRYTKLLKMMDKLNKEGLFDDQNQLKLEYNPPIRSAMDKLEEEIEPGDHMQDLSKNREVLVEDVHDAEEGYQYEMYKTVDEKGELDEVEKLNLIMIDENPERFLPTENPEMKTAAAGGTGYGDYQEKITDSSGTSMAGDISGSHEPDIYPMDPDHREGSPVPSKEYEKSKQKTKLLRHRNSVAMRKIDALATEVVGTIRMGMYRINKKRKAQVDHNTGSDHNAPTSDFIDKTLKANPGRYQPQNVAGNPVGGGYSVNETQQGEQPSGEASEEENLAATQQSYDNTMQNKELAEQMQSNDMTQQYQLRMMGAAEKQKLQIIMGSSVGAETPADSSVGQLESEEGGRLRSKTDETRKVLLHERDEDAKSDNATFPKVDDQLKPLP